MRNPNFEEPQQSKLSKYFAIYSIVVAIIFMGTGVFILLSPGLFGGFTQNQSTIGGTLLVMYGIFRLYKLYRKRKNA